MISFQSRFKQGVHVLRNDAYVFHALRASTEDYACFEIAPRRKESVTPTPDTGEIRLRVGDELVRREVYVVPTVDSEETAFIGSNKARHILDGRMTSCNRSTNTLSF